ncbi:unnamed protein product [Merluccius merluccius]
MEGRRREERRAADGEGGNEVDGRLGGEGDGDKENGMVPRIIVEEMEQARGVEERKEMDDDDRGVEKEITEVVKEARRSADNTRAVNEADGGEREQRLPNREVRRQEESVEFSDMDISTAQRLRVKRKAAKGKRVLLEEEGALNPRTDKMANKPGLTNMTTRNQTDRTSEVEERNEKKDGQTVNETGKKTTAAKNTEQADGHTANDSGAATTTTEKNADKRKEKCGKELTVKVKVEEKGSVSMMDVLKKEKKECGEVVGCRVRGERRFEITLKDMEGKEKLMD